MSIVTELYSRAPYPLKCVLADVRGVVLNRQRFPSESEQLVAEALARDAFSAAEWRAWQEDQLAPLLDRAVRLVPHYREMARRQGSHPAEIADVSRFADWPVLEKHLVRENPASFVAEDRSSRSLHTVGTSGTSGTPLAIHRRKDDTARHYAIYEARVRRWNGLSRHQPWAILGGQLVAPFSQTEPPFWVRSRTLHQLYLSTNHLAPANATAYAAELRSFAPTHLVGYPSSVAVLAQICLDQKVELPKLQRVISNAEPLSDAQRALFAEAFGCETRDTYGMGEGAAAAAECDHGNLHLSPDNGLLEILDEEGRAVPDGEVGEIVVTGLANRSMLLIRYRTGDRGALSAEPCTCGLGAPILDRIEGRVSDMVRTPDGRQVFWFNPVFAGLPLREAQIVQERLDALGVNVVPLPEWSAEDAVELERRLRLRVGEMVIDVRTVDEIERGPNGKFRPVLSRI